MSDHPLCTDPRCGRCSQRRAAAGFRGTTIDLERPVKAVTQMPTQPATPVPASPVACPNCGHVPGEPQRVTESFATGGIVPRGGLHLVGEQGCYPLVLPAGARIVPVGDARRAVEAAPVAVRQAADVEYADPGLLDGRRRHPLGSEADVRAAWEAVVRDAARYPAGEAVRVRARVLAAMRRLDLPLPVDERAAEARINGKDSFDDVRERVRRALRATHSDPYCWVCILDLTDTDVVWMSDGDKLYLAPYTLDGDTVTVGEPVEVVRTYAPAGSPDTEAATEARGQAVADVVGARVIEAKGTSKAGGRVFGVQLIAYGDSRNQRRYPRSVLEAAVGLYEGAQAYDHHRTQEEMQTGTIAGLVGHFQNVTAGEHGLEADLHLLPSATLAAESLDAALALKESGHSTGVGLSHDVFARFRSITESGQQIQEATEITAVMSVDLVSTPAAGGQAVRAVAGGITPTPQDPAVTAAESSTTKEEPVTVNLADVLAAFKEATPEQLAAAGLARAGTTTSAAAAAETTQTAAGAGERASEAGESKTSFVAGLMIRAKVDAAQLPVSFVEAVTSALPDRITEADVDNHIALLKGAIGGLERAGLAPTVTAKVTQESRDKKIAALDAMFAGNYREGYTSLKKAWADYTGHRTQWLGEGDVTQQILRESQGFDSGYAGVRSVEAIDSTTWAQALGDALHRRLMALYSQPSLQSWRKIVSQITPVNDFRENKRVRIGGYGNLAVVAQGAPYQPMQSPTDEEAVYAVIKRGGTESLTYETVRNDDIGAVRDIPYRLGLAAGITLYRYVWDMLPANAATTYDSTALFHASHGNTTATALSQSGMSTIRRLMRKQAAYGQDTNILSLVPRLLVVPPELEEIAHQIATSAVAIPSTPAGPSDTPNLHKGLDVEVIDYYTDANDWYAVADGGMCPLIEMGFLDGREDPELFTQADPNVGSNFDADKVTYKIRHIYNGTVLDHVGFQRGTQ